MGLHHLTQGGNGRVARLLASIPLLRAGLPPIVINAEAQRDIYLKACNTVRSSHLVPPLCTDLFDLESITDRNLGPLIQTIVEGIDISLDYVESLRPMQPEDLSLRSNPRAGKTLQRHAGGLNTSPKTSPTSAVPATLAESDLRRQS